MNANLYLFLAYSFIWAAIFGFSWYLDRKAEGLRKDVTLLQERIDSKLKEEGE